MTLDLTADQPAENDAASDPAPTDAALTIIATLATVDGDMLRLCMRSDGNIVLQPGGRKPIMLDKWQTLAFRAAVQALPA
jgi:hypothetical protein